MKGSKSIWASWSIRRSRSTAAGIVKNTGDGFLAEFGSVVDAVRRAIEVQRGMAERNAAVASEKRIDFRIGVNLGDVIVEEHDIFGDGVNVAARLEALAEPGGICVSRVVRDQVRDKLDCIFDDMGEQQVKNIARPVRVYALRPERTASVPMEGDLSSMLTSAPLAAPRLSIVVLPFVNLGNVTAKGGETLRDTGAETDCRVRRRVSTVNATMIFGNTSHLALPSRGKHVPG